MVLEPRALDCSTSAAPSRQLRAPVACVPEPLDDALAQVGFVVHEAAVAQLTHVCRLAPRALVAQDRVDVACHRVTVGDAPNAADALVRRQPGLRADGLVVSRRVVHRVLAVQKCLARHLANVLGGLDGMKGPVVGAVGALERVLAVAPVARPRGVHDLSSGIIPAKVTDAAGSGTPAPAPAPSSLGWRGRLGSLGAGAAAPGLGTGVFGSVTDRVEDVHHGDAVDGA